MEIEIAVEETRFLKMEGLKALPNNSSRSIRHCSKLARNSQTREWFRINWLLYKLKHKMVFIGKALWRDEKWLHTFTSTVNLNIPDFRVIICWDQLGIVYYELLKSTKPITVDGYQEQLLIRFRRARYDNMVLTINIFYTLLIHSCRHCNGRSYLTTFSKRCSNWLTSVTNVKKSKIGSICESFQNKISSFNVGFLRWWRWENIGQLGISEKERRKLYT